MDSASERAYQPAFVQLLVGEGHRILHSTRHGPLEFGKDVIAIAPDGVPCAYQLKGNPGGRLNRPQFREIQPQLQELVATAITYPGCPDIHHRSYLVTNGFIEEDVILIIKQMNETWRRQGYGDEALRVISRGDLLKMALQAGATLWPFSVSGIEGVVGVLGHRGDAHLPIQRVHALLSDIYGLATDSEPLASAELERRLPVAALLLSISLRNFTGKSNHFASASAWIIYFTYTIAALERHGVTGRGEDSLSAASDACFASLEALAVEVGSRVPLVEGETWTDSEFVQPRTGLVHALMAVHALWAKANGVTASEAGERLQKWPTTGGLWGEGAVPQLLAHHWYLSQHGQQKTDADRLASLLSMVISAQSGRTAFPPLPAPYYGVDDIVLHHNHGALQVDDPIDDDDFQGRSFTSMGLLHLVVQTGAKDMVKTIWPHFTRLSHRAFRPASSWQFCLVRSSQGRDDEVIVPERGEWSTVHRAAFDPSVPGVPQRLADDPLMLLLFTIVCPHRLTPEVTRYLGLKLLGAASTGAPSVGSASTPQGLPCC